MGNKNSRRAGRIPNDGWVEDMENRFRARRNRRRLGSSNPELYGDRIMSDLERSNYLCDPQTPTPDDNTTINSNDCNMSNCQPPLNRSVESICNLQLPISLKYPDDIMNIKLHSDDWGEKKETVKHPTVKLPDREEKTAGHDSSNGSSVFNEIVKTPRHTESHKHKKHRKHKKRRKHKHKHKKHKHRHRRSKSSSSYSSSSASSSSEYSSSEADGKHFLKAKTKKTAPKKEIKAHGYILGFNYEEDGSCTYNAYIQCNDSAEWDKFLGKTARCMTGLQRQFNVTIKLSDGILYHRGNSVRLFHINGINKGLVIRCKSALPKILLDKLITPVNGIEEVQSYAKERTTARLTLSRPNLCKFTAKSMNILNQ